MSGIADFSGQDTLQKVDLSTFQAPPIFVLDLFLCVLPAVKAEREGYICGQNSRDREKTNVGLFEQVDLSGAGFSLVSAWFCENEAFLLGNLSFDVLQNKPVQLSNVYVCYWQRM